MKTQAPQLKYPIFLPLVTKATKSPMKNLFAITLSILLFTGLSAQKVDLDKDTITVDGKAYAVLKKTSSGLETPEFSLQTTDGEEVAIAKLSTDVVPSNRATNTSGVQAHYIHITFLGSGVQASMAYYLSFKKQFAKDVVKCNLFVNGKYDPAGEKKFVILNPYKGNQVVVNNTTVIINNGGNSGSYSNYAMIDRNRSAHVYVFGNTVQQDHKNVGKVTVKNEASGGTIVYTYTYFLPDGTRVAEATINGVGGRSVNIVTFKDNNRHSTTIVNKVTAEEEIATFLIANYYL